MLSMFFAGGWSLRAAEPVEVQWRDLCRASHGRQLEIKTDVGDTVSGYCFTISADEVQIKTGSSIVKLGRKALSTVYMSRSEGPQLQRLGRGMRAGLQSGVRWLLSPAALAGVVAIPATLAWGAVSAPFCAIGDLKYLLSGKDQIKLI